MTDMSWDPDCLVQGPNSWISLKLISEGARSLFGRRPESPKNVSCSRANARLHRCNLAVAVEQETSFGLSGLPPKGLLVDFRGILGIGPGCRVPRHEAFSDSALSSTKVKRTQVTTTMPMTPLTVAPMALMLPLWMRVMKSTAPMHRRSSSTQSPLKTFSALPPCFFISYH